MLAIVKTLLSQNTKINKIFCKFQCAFVCLNDGITDFVQEPLKNSQLFWRTLVDFANYNIRDIHIKLLLTKQFPKAECFVHFIRGILLIQVTDD